MRYSIFAAAIVAATLGLSACEQKTTEKTVIQPVPVPSPAVVTVPTPVPGPQGPAGAPGAEGAPGKSGSTVIVVPPAEEKKN